MIRAAFLACLVAAPAFAESDAVLAAEAASEALAAAGEQLSEAETSRDRVAALTATVRAYETGLAALRDGMRRAALRERAIETELQGEEARLATLLGALLSMQTSPETVTLLHPAGPAGSARASMILADVSPAIEVRTRRLKSQLQELDVLRTLQHNAAITLEKGLIGVQEARTALSQAISDRTPPPDRSATDAATMQALVNSADTLEGFAASLASAAPAGLSGGSFSERAGDLALPVPGTLVAGFNAPDGTGRRRPGLTVATLPRALVTAPHAATLRYAGPLLDLGDVAILEPEPGTLLVFSGLGEAFGTPGDILAEGAPVGMMGGPSPEFDQILIETSAGTGQDRTETLYIELRRGQQPVDPGPWFALANEQDK